MYERRTLVERHLQRDTKVLADKPVSLIPESSRRKARSCSSSREISSLLWNQTIQYHIHKNQLWRAPGLMKYFFLHIWRVYVFCVDLRTNSDYFPIQHWLVGLYDQDGVCLLRGTNRILSWVSSLKGKRYSATNTSTKWTARFCVRTWQKYQRSELDRTSHPCCFNL